MRRLLGVLGRVRVLGAGLGRLGCGVLELLCRRLCLGWRGRLLDVSCLVWGGLVGMEYGTDDVQWVWRWVWRSRE